MLEKMTTLMRIMQMLKESHPIMTLVMPSIFTGHKHAVMIVATQKLTSSL